MTGVLFGPEPARRLVAVHAGLAVLIGLRIALGPFRGLAGQPAALFEPVPILAFLDRMPPVAVIAAVQIVGAVAALAAVLRRRPQLAFVVAWLGYLVLAGLRASRGKVQHNDLLLLWVSAPLVFAPISAALRARRDPTPRPAFGWPVRTAITLAVLVYVLAGYQKLVLSGASWVVGDNMRYVLLWGPSVGDPAWPSLTRWLAARGWAATLSAVAILGVELGAPLALFVRRLLPALAAALVVLHTGTWLVMGLDYWAWAGAVVVLFVDWPAVWERRPLRLKVRS